MTTINFSLQIFIGFCFLNLSNFTFAQTPQRTSNGLVIKSTSKLQPPQSVLSKSAPQKTDAKLLRIRQEREIAQQMAMQRSISNSPDTSQRIFVNRATTSRGVPVNAKK